VQTFPWLHTFISNMKRMLRESSRIRLGTYHSVSAQHLDDYLAEFTYRANRRWMEGTLFDRLVVAAIDSKAVMYKELLAGAK
jgi:ISXO2-like transposase domain